MICPRNKKKNALRDGEIIALWRTREGLQKELVFLVQTKEFTLWIFLSIKNAIYFPKNKKEEIGRCNRLGLCFYWYFVMIFHLTGLLFRPPLKIKKNHNLFPVFVSVTPDNRDIPSHNRIILMYLLWKKKSNCATTVSKTKSRTFSTHITISRT